jgi:hypothetical protein
MVRPRSLGGANIDEAVAVPAAPQPDDSDPELVDSSGSLAAEMFTASSREVRGGDASVRRRSSPPDNQRRQGWLLCSPISSAADGRLVSASRGSGSAASAGQTAARRPHAITIAGPMNHLWSSARSACPRSMTVPGLADCDDGFAGLLPGEARELRLRRTVPKQRHCDLGVGIDQCVSSQLCGEIACPAVIDSRSSAGLEERLRRISVAAACNREDREGVFAPRPSRRHLGAAPRKALRGPVPAPVCA